jgi:hypothetical protein
VSFLFYQRIPPGVTTDKVVLVGSDGEYKRYWRPLASDIEKTLGVVVDGSGKDISRLCFVSHDPHLFVRQDAELYTTCEPEPPAKTAVPEFTTIPLPTDGHIIDFYRGHAIRNASDILAHSVPGTRHLARLRAGTLLGGYAAGGFFSPDEAFELIRPVVLAYTETPRKSLKTMQTAIEYGTTRPIYESDLQARYETWRRSYSRRVLSNARTANIPEVPIMHDVSSHDEPSAAQDDEQILPVIHITTDKKAVVDQTEAALIRMYPPCVFQRSRSLLMVTQD